MPKPPKTVLDLVELFDRNIETYRSPAYNETMLRQEFINPFFEALGWDICNKAGYAQAFKDVIHEDAIKVGGATKAPDYCFRIGGARKFFLETKRPSVDIKKDVHPAYQLRRYAWSAKLPLSILTDFEEFAVFECRSRPKLTDKPGTGRILYLTYTDYADRWAEIEDVFAKESILKGSFDKYVVSLKKRGTSEVDSEFLTEIEGWRDMLARNIALRNPDLTVRELNFAVQRVIDRIIFLRMCEDRGIETYGQLQALLNGENTYSRLQYLFGLADDKYNSGLFHFRTEKGREAPDELTPYLKVDDKVIKEMIRHLYYPESPYEFSVLGADILGNVYEQFLGKVIRLTPAHQAKVEEKPEVKKAGGVYYTPSFIVDYIVKNTVGKLCENKTPRQISKLRILDPSCGSGPFLVGALTYLMEYHRDWYVKKGPKKYTKQIYQGAGGQWYLTTQEKKRILLNNIYGVDIDSQAVEITKLNLLLKVLEGENQDSLEMQQKLFRERALPDLSSNIKCGNSLIGPNFYESGQMDLLDEEEQYRINVFDWDAEFPEIMKAGGFDAVIGNPPYVQSRSGRLAEIDKVYYTRRFKTVKYQINTYGLFLERGLNLLRSNGQLGFIIPNYWLSTDSDKPLRNFLFLTNNVVEIANVYNVFENATVDTLLLIARRPHLNVFPKQCIVKSIDRLLKTIPERLIAVHNVNLDRAVFPKINANTLEKFPVPKINFADPKDKTCHDRMVKLVEWMLDLHKRLAKAKTTYEKTNLQHQINATDQQIDHLVYELYGLMDVN
jgi:type I restriction-modification system DNA methylase subunit